MKRIYKYGSGLALAGLLSIALISPANAQRGGHSGGVHISGGGRSGGGFSGALGFGLRSGASLAVRGGFFGGRFFYGYPTLGFHMGLLPGGFYPFYCGSDLFYYSGGIFYRPMDGGGYEVTVPPVGAAVPSLPKGAQSIVIDGKQFYTFDGVYYQESTDENGKKIFVVAGKDGTLNTNTNDEGVDNQPPAPMVGDITEQLPEGSRKITLKGKTYYVAPDGIYYEDFRDSHNVKAYRIVSIPTADNDDQEHQN